MSRTGHQEDGNHGQPVVSWPDDLVQDLGHVRSFSCSFCHRGFSNAQALGGHMNIHRKDRAKLREFSHDNLLSLDLSKNVTDHGESASDDPHAAHETSRPEGLLSSDDECNLETVPTVKEIARVPGLPLFAETPASSSAPTGDRRRRTASTGRSEKAEMSECICGDDVDLELRLGPEPRDARTNR